MTDTKETGGPAFPRTAYPGSDSPHTPYAHHEQDGMSLRDYFAAKALQGWLASFGSEAAHPATGQDGESQVLYIAQNAYALADAMLKARQP